jgi:hypothetical protein
MKMFRKTLTTEVMGWKPLIMAVRAAADRWSATEMKRLLKEFFDPNEYAYLWTRVSKFTDTKEQLESRLQAQEDGIRLPQGNQKRYIKWLQNTDEATEHAKMMILLQRTQELDISEWWEIREQAYVRFGKERYKELLQERDEIVPEAPKGSIPTFNRKRIMFGAMKEEQAEITPEWSRYLPETYECLRSGQNYTKVLQELMSATEEETKMKKIRKNIRSENEDWEKQVKVMKEHKWGDGFEWMRSKKNTVGTLQMNEQWEKARSELRQRTDEVHISQSIKRGMELIPEYLAQWDWYAKRAEEAKAPVLDQWKKLDP